MRTLNPYLTVGEAAERAGVAASALRYYESRGLIQSIRTTGNQRRYHRATLRRISVIRAAQQLGLTLDEITEALSELPNGRTPTKRDWQRLSTAWKTRLNQRIDELERMRDSLSACIGCGCLSLKSCALFNAGDQAARKGAGPRYLLGDRPVGAKRPERR